MQFDVHTHSIDKISFRILNSGLEIQESRFFSAGVHPWDAENFSTAKLVHLKEISSNTNCLAIGEIGLDKLKGPAFQLQIEVFKQQVLVAEEKNLPVIIHCTKAWNELRQIKHLLQPKSPWIFHGFSKTAILQEVLDEGMYISLGAQLLRNKKLILEIKKVPLDRIVLETDDAAVSIKTIYSKLSELKEVSLQEIEDQIEENVFKLFPKWKTGLKEPNY